MSRFQSITPNLLVRDVRKSSEITFAERVSTD